MNISGLKEALPKFALVATIIVIIAIGVLSLLPGSDLPAQNLNDKLNHFIAYGVLSFLALLGRHKVSLMWVIVAAIGYGVALEVLQGAMPYGRSASWLDAIANTGGVLGGVIFGLLAVRWLSRF